jgi:uncharacterized membrane protein
MEARAVSVPAGRLVTLALGFLACAACGAEPPPEAATDGSPNETSTTRPRDVAVTSSQEVEGSRGPPDLPELVFFALGNEPFWNVRVFEDGLRYEALGEEPVLFASPRQVHKSGSGRWEWTAESGTRFISVTIEESPCSDTMSDVSYRYVASVRLGERSLAGCALAGGLAKLE